MKKNKKLRDPKFTTEFIAAVRECCGGSGVLAAEKLGESQQVVSSWLNGVAPLKITQKAIFARLRNEALPGIPDDQKQVASLVMQRLLQIKASWRSHMTDRDGIKLAINTLFKKDKHVILNWLEEEQESDKKKYMATGTDG